MKNKYINRIESVDYYDMLFDVGHQINNCCEDYWEAPNSKNYFLMRIGAFFNEIYNSNWWEWFFKEYEKLFNNFIYDCLNDSVNNDGFYDIDIFGEKVRRFFLLCVNADIVDDNLHVKDWDKYNEFNYIKFINGIDLEVVKELNSDFKKEIENIAFVYKFNLDDMINLFDESINHKGWFDIELLKRRANTLYLYRKAYSENKNKENINENIDIEVGEMINYCESVSPSDMLEALVPKYPAKYLEIINDIYTKIDLPKGILNVMIMKVLKDKNGELPSVNYFKKVADTWVNDGIVNTKDAINYVTKK